MSTLRKFSSQADPEVLEGLQDIAAREGRQFQAVLGEAMRAYLAQKHQHGARRAVIGAFEESLKERDALYRSLAGSGLRVRAPVANSPKPKQVAIPGPLAHKVDVVQLLLEERQSNR